MFWKKKQQIGISRLEKRICDLENPYKYKIGDKILFSNELYVPEKYFKGLIVDAKFEYCSIYKNQFLLSEYTYITNYPLEFIQKEGTFNRYNKYLILLDGNKESIWINEDKIKL